MKERRKYFRMRMKGLVDIKGSEKAGSVDVSTNGICLLLNKKMNRGDTVQIEFNFPDMPNKSTAKAKVRWQKKVKNGYYTGLEFDTFHLTIKT
ncbi:MAG: PilZ domain-containing protein [Spirochaetes bacterium]|nr:PilZ domain-containing protein [Spirochaetota bacterium]